MRVEQLPHDLRMNGEAQDRAFTAMCLWESILNGPAMDQLKPEDRGTGELREFVASLTYVADKAYQIALAVGYDDCFDWEFIPSFVSRCVNWATWELYDDWPEIALKIGRDS